MSFFGANTIVRFSTEWFIAHRFIDFFFFLIIFVWFSFCTSERGAWIEWVILLKGRQKILGGRCVWTCVCVCICNEVCLSLCPLKPLNCSHSYASFFIFFFFQDTPRSRSHKRWVWPHLISAGEIRCFSIASLRCRSKGLNSFSRWPQLCTIHSSGGFCQMYKNSPGLKICLSESAEKEASHQKKGI